MDYTDKFFKVLLVKKDPDLIETVSKKRDLPLETVEAMLRYNVFTEAQFSELTGKGRGWINSNTKTFLKSTPDGEKVEVSKLDIIYPFEYNKGMGPKFIVRNEKSMSWITA